MKRILNPKLDSKQETVLIDTTSNEETEVSKMDSKSKKKLVSKPSSSQPAKVKGLSQSIKELRQPKSELSAIIFEIKNKLLEQQQKEKSKVAPIENQEWEEEDELILREAGILKDPSIPADFIDLLIKDANIPEIPSFEQESMTEGQLT